MGRKQQKIIAILLIGTMTSTSAMAGTVPRIPGFSRQSTSSSQQAAPLSNALPDLKQVIQGAIVKPTDTATNTATIQGTSDLAIIEWKNFDVGSAATVQFQQDKGSWAALNRIYSSTPSQIFGKINGITLDAQGKITGNCKIYLINQNGVLFGQGSQVNVSGLIASSLNLEDEDFKKGILHFKRVDYGGTGFTGNGAVINNGTITTTDNGQVFLIGPQVQNGSTGTITSPYGQIGLIAGEDVTLARDPAQDSTRTALIAVVKTNGDSANPNVASNLAGGTLSTTGGLVGMYGMAVNQNGIIRSVTTLKDQKNGTIELQATDRITLGAGSRTETPVTDSTYAANPNAKYVPGEISLTGLVAINPDIITSDKIPVKQIINNGSIYSPGGTVTMTADEHVSLEKGSSIDVSGLWIDKAADANLIEAPLNSVNLRDDFGQKNGILLKDKIYFDAHAGSSIGDVSGYLVGYKEQTAQERSLSGGNINLTAKNGDVILRDGASLKFAGGGTNYAAGSYATTILKSGNTWYDIANAPEWLTYNAVSTKTYNHAAHSEGADAGKVGIIGKQVVLDGSLDGSVKHGKYADVFQTMASDPINDSGHQKARGWMEPLGGTLTIGSAFQNENPQANDAIVKNIVVTASNTPLPGSVGADDSHVSADTLNNAGLGTLNLYANGKISMEAGSDLRLTTPGRSLDTKGNTVTQPNSGGSFTASARTIELNGKITVPAGTVSLTTTDTVTSFDTAGNQVGDRSRITIGGSGGINVSGEVTDRYHTLVATDTPVFPNTGRTTGGSVIMKDISVYGDGVFVSSGAALDLNGGYYRNQSGKLTAGNAGSLTMSGATVQIDGTMNGYSVVGKKGGKLTVNAGEVVVSNDPPADSTGKFVFDNRKFTEGGFGDLDLRSETNLTVASGVTIAPSTLKMSVPLPGENAGLVDNPYELPASTLSLSAGTIRDRIPNKLITNIDTGDSKISVAAGSSLAVSAGGTITATGRQIDFAGSASAPAGSITMTGSDSLNLRSGAKLSATGFVLPDTKSLVAGGPLGASVKNGGTIVLEGTNTLNLEAGSALDVSGSRSVVNYLRGNSGQVVSRTIASNPGTIKLTYAGDAALNSTLLARQTMANGQGGSLIITNSNVQTSTLWLAGRDLSAWKQNGFDNYTFKSQSAIQFADSFDFSAGRGITLDAPTVIGSGTDRISLSAPWLQLINTQNNPGTGATAGGATLALSGDWLDLSGSTAYSGFAKISAAITRDVRVKDSMYSTVWAGRFETAGDLDITASRIYPVMQNLGSSLGTVSSSYTIHAGGDLSLLPSHYKNSSAVYSTGGRIDLEAGGNVTVGTVVAAPAGTITVTSLNNQRISLADGGLLTTGGGLSVNYGIADDQNWTVQDKTSNTKVDFTALPQQAVTLTAGEIVTATGSKIDISGNGSVFGYSFLSGTKGTNNPLQRTGSFVIVPNSNFDAPGDAVYLAGAPGLPAGVYSILPQYYAFLPGAMVVTPLNSGIAPDYVGKTKEGYTISAGFITGMGSGQTTTNLMGYSIRSAADVLKEGDFVGQSYQTGNGGSLTMKADTTIIGGTIDAHAATSTDPAVVYTGGTLSMSGKNVYVQQENVDLSGELSTLLDTYRNSLVISTGSVSGKGFREIDLGDATSTDTLTVKTGSILEAGSVKLAAHDQLTIEDSAKVTGSAGDGTGTVSLSSPTGAVTIGNNAVVRAADRLDVAAADATINGTLTVDHGTLNFNSGRIFLAADGTDKAAGEKGIYLTESRMKDYAALQGVGLTGSSEVVLKGNVAVNLAGNLAIDAPLIRTGNADGSALASTITAKSLTLANSSGTTTTGYNRTANSSLTVTANEMVLDGGDVRFDGFSSLNLVSSNAITIQKTGSLKTAGALGMKAQKLTTAYSRDINSSFVTTNYSVEAQGKVIISDNGRTSLDRSEKSAGGVVDIKGASIEHSGFIDVDAGSVKLTATGNGAGDGISIKNGGVIATRGTADFQAGDVTLTADNGTVKLSSGSRIDVSAGTQGDAGSVTIAAINGAVSLNGEIAGSSQEGRGGAITIDGKSLVDSTDTPLTSFKSLNDGFSAGGFTESIDVRDRTGKILVDAGTTVTARTVRLTADAGNVEIKGTVKGADASGQLDGTVELNAGNNLSVGDGAIISATGANDGGTILLASAGGNVNLDSGSTIDLTGSIGVNGSLTLRALKNGNDDVNIKLAGTVKGVQALNIKAVKQYVYSTDKTLMQADYDGWTKDLSNYSFNPLDINNRLYSNLNANGLLGTTHLIQEIEVRGAGNITVGGVEKNGKVTDIDMSTWRYGGEPVALTIRAANNLKISANILDKPSLTPYDPWVARTQSQSGAQRSADINLVAGSDLSSADMTAVNKPTSTYTPNLAIDDKKVVYSEKGRIALAAGNNVTIGITNSGSVNLTDTTTSFNVGSYDGKVKVRTGNDLILNGGVIQTATGDIDLQVGRNLTLNTPTVSGVRYAGTVRTMGVSPLADQERQNYLTSGKTVQPSHWQEYWNYTNGGDISITARGSIAGDYNLNAWDTIYGTTAQAWSASHTKNNSQAVTQGLATLGGGNLTIKSGRNFKAQAGTFGTGNLSVAAGGDLLGHFLVKDGTGVLKTVGNAGKSQEDRLLLEGFNTKYSVAAQGDIIFGSMTNPQVIKLTTAWDLGYSQSASLKLQSLTGSILFKGNPAADTDLDPKLSLLPATVGIRAAQDVLISTAKLYMAPAAIGNLIIEAGGSIDGKRGVSSVSSILMADNDSSLVYGTQQQPPVFSDSTHYENLLHAGDSTPVTITAGGDIRNLTVTLPKQAVITAGNDLQDVNISIQNVSSSNASRISAGRDIIYSSKLITQNTSNRGVQVAGPGSLLVRAGRNIDLGTSDGIQSIGNVYNANLGVKGSALIVAAGTDATVTEKQANAYFVAMRTIGDAYSKLLAQGDKTDADKLLADMRKIMASGYDSLTNVSATAGINEVATAGAATSGNITGTVGSSDQGSAVKLLSDAIQKGTIADIRPLLTGGLHLKTDSSINMVASQISSTSGKDDIYVFTGKDMNVGKTAFSTSSDSSKSTGIFTSAGGSVNIFAGHDVNVNESRVMTFGGGDITVWADTGDINAGRGSRTTISVDPPQKKPVPNTNPQEYVLVFSPPAVGSGIRALAGDPYIYTPNGIVDAGEAGIYGNVVHIVAQQVLNAGNITGGQVFGVKTSDTTVSIPSISSTSSLADSTKMVETTTAAGDKSSDAGAVQQVAQLLSGWLDVKVINFDQDEQQ